MSQIQIMALRHSAFYSPLLLTISGGFLRDEGLEPTYAVETPSKSVVDSINNDNCHLAQSAVATSIVAAENGRKSDIVHFAQINVKDGFFIAAREPDPDFTWENLIGKSVLVDHFFQPYAMLNYGLYQQGIQLSQLNVIDAGDVNQIDQAFRNGQADYVHQQGPAPQQLEYEGLAHVVAAVGDSVGPVAFSSLCAKRDWLETPMAKVFMRAYQHAMAFAINAPAQEIAVLHQQAGFFLDIDASVLASTIRCYQDLGCWQDDIGIGREGYETLLKVFNYNKSLRRNYAYHEFIVSPPD